MAEIEVRFKVWVGDFPETRLTKNNIIRKIERLRDEILDDFDETIHDIEVYEDGEQQELTFPNSI
ncbi:MAG: hypothetical protein J5989_08780 [Alistipes sp.]|nr:hypothetical protein [Alistipes sp.]MBR4115651.1 hypothetical protein [Bacteroidales bacterium]